MSYDAPVPSDDRSGPGGLPGCLLATCSPCFPAMVWSRFDHPRPV